jgi:formate dehydrogenase iron-sulfur subunit
MKALLIDSTKCIGCRGCQVACKQWNELSGEETTFFSGTGYQNPPDLSPQSWTLISYNEIDSEKGLDWVFSKSQCFHCATPACASACPVSALVKTEEGPVVYDPDICLGCRYCQLACPFKVPRFEWSKVIPEITKCTMCADRIKAGLETACAKACPTDAIVFGDREELIAEAENRIKKYPNRYVDYIYGKDEVGGTSVLYLSSVPFDQIGFDTKIPKEPIVTRAEHAMKPIPYVLTGLGLVLGGVSWIINRKKELQDEVKTGKEG